MFAYLNNEFLSASPHKFVILIIMPLSATVCSSPASEGACPQSAGGEPGNYILTGFSPVAELWAFSWYPVRYPDFGWYPVRYLELRLTPRVSTLKSHARPHIEGTRLYSYCLSHLTTHALARSSNTPWTASASSL